jgi:hypothetical protein
MTTYLAKQLFDGYALHNNMQMSVENGHISSIIPAANSSIKPNVHLNGLVVPVSLTHKLTAVVVFCLIMNKQ